MKFAASLSWRVLFYYNAHGHLDEVPAHHLPQIDAALEEWRLFLLDQTDHPGRFEHHLLPMDEVSSSTVPDMPTAMNRYILRSIDMDVVTSEKTALVYTKLPSIAVVGFVEMRYPRSRWQGTRIAARDGTIMPRQYVIPQAFGEYVMGKARIGQEALAGMSAVQKELVKRGAGKSRPRREIRVYKSNNGGCKTLWQSCIYRTCRRGVDKTGGSALRAA
ncbi:MAG TPA: hypothetical protein VJ865_11230 [Gemmatimonadaceae bacterium]|nr:hypothetical protein [Gemmatimonadaceae bacterium]